MTADDPHLTQRDLILRCRQGDEDALGQLLEIHRGWLKTKAETELDGQMAGRVDASDLVQQTFLSACNKIAQFEGATSGEFAAWLAQIHQRNIQDAVRKHIVANKRSVGREHPLADGQAYAGSDASTPSRQAIREEQAIRLRTVLEALPADQREAVRLRHLEGWSLMQIAQHMNRSRDAVASLLKRGVENLRGRIRED